MTIYPEPVAWRSRSHGDGGDCLEIVWRPDGVCLRSHENGVSLFFSFEEWDAFVAAVKGNRFDADRLA